MTTRRISADEAQSLRRDQVRDGRLLKVASSATPPSWNAEQRSARFVMTSETKDRYGDVVVMDGIDITEFMKNPVAFLNHNSSSFPIGQWRDLQRYSHAAIPRLEGTLALAAANSPIPQIDQAAFAIQSGLMKAVSIGFLPVWDSVEKLLDKAGNWDGGLQFNESELIECSLCGVPANPQALAKGLGGKPPKDTKALELWLRTPEGERAVRRRMRQMELSTIKQRGIGHGPR